VFVKDNITINCLCPGFVETGLTKAAVPFMDPSLVVPMTAIVDAVNRFIEGSETGCWAAVNFDGTQVTKQPDITNAKHKAVLDQLGGAKDKLEYPARV
jgi:NAD(P)-dependent dehydrogenase (short-subunit alcohol dehydrogenase family)